MLAQDLERVRRWVTERNAALPGDVRDRLHYELDETPRHLTIIECRPSWRPEGGTWSRIPVARLRFTTTRNEWALYIPRRRGEFQEYGLAVAGGMVGRLLFEIDSDPGAIFWG